MADTRISQFTELESPNTGDKLVIVDSSDTTQSSEGTTKFVSYENLITPAGSGSQIQFNDGGSFVASANLTWDDNGLYSNGYISGTAISGTSFHGPHFVSAPYSIGNTSGAVTIDFNNGSAQYATLNGDVTSFAASNAVAGEGVVVKFYTATTRTIAPGSSLSFLGELPTGLSAGMTGALSLLAFSSSDIMAGFVAQTGIG